MELNQTILIKLDNLKTVIFSMLMYLCIIFHGYRLNVKRKKRIIKELERIVWKAQQQMDSKK